MEPHCLTEAWYARGERQGQSPWRCPLSLFTKDQHIRWGAALTDAAVGDDGDFLGDDDVVG